MTDAEMMEAAAKAAGVEIHHQSGDGALWVDYRGVGLRAWNPRNNDGDSRRLQVALRLEVSVGQEGVTAVDEFGAVEYTEWFPTGASLDDRCAATRLVVLKCAAAIHEAQPS